MQKVGLGTVVWAAVILVGVIWLMSSNNNSEAPAAQASTPAAAAPAAPKPSAPVASAWAQLGPGMYVTSPAGKKMPVLMLTADDQTGMPMLLLMVSPAAVCQSNGQNISSDLGPLGTYYVNDAAVQFKGYCLVGKEMMKPANPPDMKTFMDAFSGLAPIVTVTTPDGAELQYATNGFLSSSAALLRAKLDKPN